MPKIKTAKKPSAKIPPMLTGVAGEYFVAAELSRQGYIASISLRNTRGIDILATNQDGSRSITIQCKTNQSGQRNWMLNKKSESFFAKDHFYVFVALKKLATRPSFHVVPSKIVADHIKYYHRKWLRTPGLLGQKHKDTPMRKFTDSTDEYRDRWDLLGL